MKKNIGIFIMCLIAVVLTGCNNNTNNTIKNNLEDRLFIKIDGIKYEIHKSDYSLFKKNGWILEDESKEGMTIDGQKSNSYNHSSGEVKLINNKYGINAYIYAKFYNDNDDDITIDKALLGGIIFYLSDTAVVNKPQVEIYGGIKLLDGLDKIEKSWGTADNVFNSFRKGYYYGTSFVTKPNITLYLQDNQLCEIKMYEGWEL